MNSHTVEHPPARALTLADAGILALLLGANLTAFTSEIMMGGVYPALAERFGVSLETVVLLTTPRALAQLGVLVLGPLSDRLGRAWVLVGALCLLAVAGWGNAWAPSLQVMVVPQAAVGLGFATILACVKALVGDRYPYAIRGRVLAIVQMGLPLTLIVLVPGMVALAFRVNGVAPFVAMGSVATLLALLAAWRLPGAAHRPRLPSHSEERSRDWAQPRVLVILGLMLALSMVPSAIFNFLSGWVSETFGDPARTVGLVIAGDGLGTLIGISSSAVIVDRLTKRRATVMGLAVTGVFALLLPHTHRGLGLAFAAVAGLSAGLEVALIALAALLTELVPRARGTVMSLWMGAQAAGGALSPLMAAQLWRRGGMAVIASTGGALVLAVAVAMFLVAAEPARASGGEMTPGGGL